MGMRVGLLTLSILAFSGAIFNPGYTITALGLGGLILIQTWWIIKKVENTNRELVIFLNSIKYDDFSYYFQPTDKGKTFQQLSQAFNQAVERFRQVRSEKEAHCHYLRSIIHHMNIGLISFDAEGNIKIINAAARRMLKLSGKVQHIRDLASVGSEMVDKLIQLPPSSRELIKLVHSTETIHLSVDATVITLQGKEYKLISLQNIQTELEEQELDAWKQLVRVLTHEIMNSVTPIASLAATLESEAEDLQTAGKSLTTEELSDWQTALKTIQRRSEGLMRFISDFRNLTQLPEPHLKNVAVAEIFEHILRLMESDLKANEIAYHTEIIPSSLMITADREMIEQALINIVKNAIEALSNRAEGRMLWLQAYYDHTSHPLIVVRDNGPGIDPDAIERIFVPFYTTKKSGSGIGLSFSRQVMRAHKGTLTVHSTLGEGAAFIMRF
ncbi:MAG: ATP-binding protein [Cytophagales bacterium]|nr:ATP-binding protein [Cytophagales bacterium]